MTIQPGNRLGPYEVVAPIGAGGMGEGIARATPVSTAPSRSRSSRPSSAKELQAGGAIVGLTNAATQQKQQLTQEGTILGTFQYMAPEQLEGAEAGAQTDIWAFGAVLYEMVTGRKAFEGKSKTSLIAAIVDRDPQPVSAIQPLTPPALDHLIAKCLGQAG